ncbi:hypothetical protein ACFFU9_04235 [Mariniflexile ostreae]|uniref:PAP2 superfamily protein n=1 Tax=Mariniflexile ostreae TaxID=1520892 RepID=A0ABV5F9X4_9FLAO
MIHFILKSISYIFHPLLMPLFGVIFYFYQSPRFIPKDVVSAKVISISILTILLPILVYSLLKIIGKAKSIHLQTTRERIIPLAANCIIVFLIINYVVTSELLFELYFFFLGILISNLSCLILAVMNFKASIHMIAASGIIMFFIALSIHFSININTTLAIMTILVGAIATSRLHLNAHTYKELIMGVFIGFVPQLLLVSYWL